MFIIKEMERLFGTRKYGDFLKPRVIAVGEMRFPTDSALYWSGDKTKLNKLVTHTQGDVKTYVIETYFKDKDGDYRTTSFKRSSYVALRKKEDENKKFTFISNRLSMGLTSMNKLLLFDFNMLKEKYKYANRRDSVYFESLNILSTKIDGMNEPDKLTSRNAVFIDVNIPMKIPSLADIKKYRTKHNHYVTDKLGKDSVHLVEIINYLMGDKSVFDKIQRPEQTFITFLIGNKVSVSRLSNIRALNKSNNIETSDIKGVNSNTALLTFLAYLVRITILASRTLEDLKNDSKTDVRNLEDKDGKYIEDDLSESYLEELIQEHNTTMTELKEVEESIPTDTKTLEEEYKHEPTMVEMTERVLENKVNAGVVTPNIAKKLIEKAKEADVAIAENQVTEDDVTLKGKYKDNDFVVDKHLLSSVNENMIKQYISKVYKKNLTSMIYSLSASGNVVTRFESKVKKDIANETEELTIEFTNDKGTTSTVRVYIPVIREDGTMLQNGNTYIMLRQESGTPIAKVNATKVALSSYYSKLFVSKSENNTNNIGAGIYKQLSKNEDVSILVKGKTEVFGIHLPDIYNIMARTIKSFNMHGVMYSFDYHTKDKTFDGYKGKHIPIGKKGKSFYSMDMNGMIYKDEEELSDIYTHFNIDESILPVEYANLQLMGERVPLVIILSYYYGLNTVIKKLGASMRTQDNKKDLKPNEYAIRFEDGYMVFDRNDRMARLIFGGLTRIKALTGLELKELNSREGVLSLMTMMGLPIRLSKELDLLDNLWVDPVTKDILKIIKEPTTFRGLLYRAVELLMTEYTERPNYIKTKVFKGYDRMAGLVYRALVTKIREHEHKLGKVQTKITMNPYDVMSMLSQDSTFAILDDLNPLAIIKHKEEITMTGMFGRDRMAVADKDREFDPSAIGVISEATKDSKNVGITTFLSAAPNIKNVYGVVTDVKDIKDMTNADIYSTVTNLMALSDKDDGKRMLTSTIMASHMVPTVGQMVFPINRGMEAIIPYKVGSKYVRYATKDGVVKKVSKRYVEVTYDDGDVKYPLNKWTTKEVGGLAYTHTNVSDLQEGDKIKPFDIITYDSLFFGKNSQVKNTILYKGGQLARVMLDDTDETFEDSYAITKAYAEKSATKLTSVKTKVLHASSEIFSAKKIGDTVSYHDVLIHFDENYVSGFKELENLSEASDEILNNAKSNKLKAEASGVITNIIIYYNCEIDEMSDTLKDMVRNSDNKLKLVTGFTGRVDNGFSEYGVPLKEGTILIKYNIEKNYVMTYGDKSVTGLQLKATVGEVIEEIVTEDGEQVDMKFGSISVSARIVESPMELGSTYAIINEANKRVIELYRK